MQENNACEESEGKKDISKVKIIIVIIMKSCPGKIQAKLISRQR